MFALFRLTTFISLALYITNLRKVLKPPEPTKLIPPSLAREEGPSPPVYLVEGKESHKMTKGNKFLAPPRSRKRVPQTPTKEAPLVLKDAEKQVLLGMLIKRGVLELKPTLTGEGVHYTEAEETWGVTDPLWIKSTLESLEKEGALESRFFDRALTCPECGSPDVYSKYACPRCDSYNVEYTELLEHMKCGHIGSKSNFIKGSSLICPGCRYEIPEEEHRVIGSCYQCEKCGYYFDAPKIIHLCQHCHRSFTHKEAKYIKIYAYKITDEIIDKFGRTLPLIETIGKTLREKGFTTRFHHQITGASGVTHPFDIVAEKGESRIVIDLSVAGDKNDAVSLLGKKIDVSPAESLLIDLSDREELAALGKVYGIRVVKGADKKRLENDLRSLLTTLNSAKG